VQTAASPQRWFETVDTMWNQLNNPDQIDMLLTIHR
jgi:hypothetical protein